MMFPVAVGLMQYIIHDPLQQWFSTGESPDHKGSGDPLKQWFSTGGSLDHKGSVTIEFTRSARRFGKSQKSQKYKSINK